MCAMCAMYILVLFSCLGITFDIVLCSAITLAPFSNIMITTPWALKSELLNLYERSGDPVSSGALFFAVESMFPPRMKSTKYIEALKSLKELKTSDYRVDRKT